MRASVAGGTRAADAARPRSVRSRRAASASSASEKSLGGDALPGLERGEQARRRGREGRDQHEASHAAGLRERELERDRGAEARPHYVRGPSLRRGLEHRGGVGGHLRDARERLRRRIRGADPARVHGEHGEALDEVRCEQCEGGGVRAVAGQEQHGVALAFAEHLERHAGRHGDEARSGRGEGFDVLLGDAAPRAGAGQRRHVEPELPRERAGRGSDGAALSRARWRARDGCGRHGLDGRRLRPRRRLGRRVRGRVEGLVGTLGERRQQRAAGRRLAGGHVDVSQEAARRGLDLRLVLLGLDHEQDPPLLDASARGHAPLDDRALLHRHAELRHAHGDRGDLRQDVETSWGADGRP
jgi:hypothetical protein